MRIGISGIGGTGKTTLARALATRIAVPCVDEGVREWLAARSRSGPWSLTAEDQMALQQHAIAYKIERETLPAFVSDRTTVDAVVLMTLRFERLGAELPLDLRDLALHHARGYDTAIVLGPRRASDAPDHVAMLDASIRPREHALMLELYEQIGTRLIVVPPIPAGAILPFVEAHL